MATTDDIAGVVLKNASLYPSNADVWVSKGHVRNRFPFKVELSRLRWMTMTTMTQDLVVAS